MDGAKLELPVCGLQGLPQKLLVRANVCAGKHKRVQRSRQGALNPAKSVFVQLDCAGGSRSTDEDMFFMQREGAHMHTHIHTNMHTHVRTHKYANTHTNHIHTGGLLQLEEEILRQHHQQSQLDGG